VEPCGDGAHGDAATHVRHEGRHHRPPVEEGRPGRAGVGPFERVVSPRITSVDRELQLHRRLALISHALPEPGEGSHGIEEAADARGGRGVDAALQHAAQRAALHRRQVTNRREVLLLEGLRPLHREQHRGSRAPRLPDRLVAARKAKRPKGGDAPDAVGGDREELAAPDRAIEPVPGAIPGDAERGRRQVVLGHAAEHVSHVVLNLDDSWQLAAGSWQRIAQSRRLARCRHRLRAQAPGVDGRGVVGVGVAGDNRRADVVDPLQRGRHLLEGGQRFGRLQVPDVLADERLLPNRQGDRVLELRADGQHLRPVSRNLDRHRRVSARPPDHQFAPQHDAQHRIVGVARDRTVVHEEHVRQPLQPRESLPLVGADRLVRPVAAGRHDRPPQVRQQQVVQGCVGKHDAQAWVARRHGAAHAPIVQLLEQDDRGFGRDEEPRLRIAEAAERGRHGAITDHEGKGLLLAGLRGPQPGHGLVVAGIGHQVEPAEALERDDRAAADRRHRSRQRLIPSRENGAVRRPQLEARPARRACVRLRVEPAVQRVVVLRLARPAHPEPRHRRARPVVRQAMEDRETRAAVGAVGERVAEATVRRVEQLAQAVGTRGDVRQHERRLLTGRAFADLEARQADRVEHRRLETLDHGAGWTLLHQARAKLVQARRRSLDLDGDARRGVDHPPGQTHARREPVHEGPEADALDRAADRDSEPMRAVLVLIHGKPGRVPLIVRGGGQCVNRNVAMS